MNPQSVFALGARRPAVAAIPAATRALPGCGKRERPKSEALLESLLERGYRTNQQPAMVVKACVLAKPEGDDVLGDLTNAGMKFTNPLRPGDPGTLRVSPLAR
jgi:hypothetical protein